MVIRARLGQSGCSLPLLVLTYYSTLSVVAIGARAAIKTSLLAQEGHREANEQVGALATMVLGRSVSPDDREEFQPL